MMKIALVSLVEDRYWQSCYLITNGLRDAYGRLGNGFHIDEWRLSRWNSAEAVHKIASDIALAKADLVVFLDTSPLYGLVIKHLHEHPTHLPKLRFHAYGDFTMRAYLWDSWEKDLSAFDTEWVCASTRQQKMVSALTNDAGLRNWVCPFPVSHRNFHFDLALRAQTRRKLGFKTNDFVIYYAGRLALQKNVLAILQLAPSIDRALGGRARFVFAGDFDDRGAPFHEMRLKDGEMYCLWQSELAKLSPSLRRRIHVLGGIDHQALPATYTAADCFLSLSLQHDEDFGMAPAEAALSGLPMVLTDWGGYADFQMMGAEASMIPVQLSEAGPLFDLGKTASAIEAIAARGLSGTARKKQGRLVADHLSISAVSKTIRSHTSATDSRSVVLPFKNFSSLLKDVSTLFDEARQHLVYPGCAKGSTYEQIYQHYV